MLHSVERRHRATYQTRYVARFARALHQGFSEDGRSERNRDGSFL